MPSEPSVDSHGSEPFDPLASDSPLIVYLDVKSPYAFVAKDPTFEMVDDLGIEVDCRPLTLDIPSYLGSARLGKSGEVVEQNRTADQWSAVKYAYRDARRYATLRGLTLRGTVKIWDTSLAHIGMMWAKRHGREVLRRYLDRVFLPFWRRELDVEDPAVVAAVLEASGAEVTDFLAFLAGEGRREHDEMQRKIFDAGIFGVPSFVVGGEVFFGRENLPMVRWLLEGRRGSPPDVAYRSFGSGTAAPMGGAIERTKARSSLVVAIDFAQPESYLALAPTLELARDLGIEIDWRPFAVPALPPPSPDREGDDRGTRHRRFRARYRENDLWRYAGVQGLALRGLYRPTDPTLAGIGLLWLQEHAPGSVSAYLQRVFAGYWSETLDLEDPVALRNVLESLGVDVTSFDSASGRREYENVQRELREAGMLSAPGYLLDGELFLGRAHLPMIRWLLEDKRGPAPI